MTARVPLRASLVRRVSDVELAKFQTTSTKSQTNSNSQIPKTCFEFGACNLLEIWCLLFRVWPLPFAERPHLLWFRCVQQRAHKKTPDYCRGFSWILVLFSKAT